MDGADYRVEMSRSESMLLGRCSRRFASEPLCTLQPSREISPVERRWGLEVLCEPWEPLPFNTHVAWRISGVLRVDALHRAVVECARRHSILRAGLRQFDDGWRFVRHEAPEPTVCRLGPVGASAEGAEASALELLREFVWRRFRLDTEGPLRTAVVQIADHDWLVGVAVHHSFTDIYSNRILTYELAVLYEAFCRQECPPLMEPPLQFVDYMISMENWSGTRHANAQVAHWAKYLDGAQMLRASRGPTTSWVPCNLPHGLSQAVRELGRAENLAPYLVWEALHHVSLAHLLHQTDITTLSINVGRKQRELVNLIGQFVNLLPNRSHVLPGMTFRQLLRQVGRTWRECAEFRSTPYRLITDRCQLPLDSALGVLNFIPREFLPLSSLGRAISFTPPAEVASRVSYPYSLTVVEKHPEFAVVCFGNIREPFTASDLALTMERVSVAALANPDCECGSL